MLPTLAVALVLPEATRTDWTLTWRLSISARWLLIAFSQRLAPPSRATTLADSISPHIFLYSPVVAAVWKFAIDCATSCSSPWKPEVETALPQPASPRASNGRQRIVKGRRMGRVG